MVDVIGFNLISLRKETDNMRKGEVFRGRDEREVKGEWCYICRGGGGGNLGIYYFVKIF